MTFNSAKAQRVRTLARLREGSATTIELRRDLDIMMPAARVHELRNAGYQIDMVWTVQPTECGRTHRVGRYYLIGGQP